MQSYTFVSILKNISEKSFTEMLIFNI